MIKIAAAIAKAVLYTVFFLAVQVVTAVVFSVFAGLFDEIRHAIFGVWEDSFFTKNLISLVTIFSAAVTLLLLFVFFAMRGKHLSHEVRFRKMPSAGQAMLGPVCAGFGLTIPAIYLISFLPLPAAWQESYSESIGALQSGNVLLMEAATVLAAPLVEEVIFRGLVYTRMKRVMPVWVAALLSAVIFGAVHGTLLHQIYVIPMGLILCLFLEKYNSLWAAVLMHMSFNLGGTVVGYYDVSNPVIFCVILGIGIFLTVLGFLQMKWYRDAHPTAASPS